MILTQSYTCILNANNSLVNKVYSSTAKNSKWLNTVKDWVNTLGFGHLNFHTNNIAFYLTNIKQWIHDHAIQNIICSIRECSKLEFFQNVSEINERSAYTDRCKFKEEEKKELDPTGKAAYNEECEKIGKTQTS